MGGYGTIEAEMWAKMQDLVKERGAREELHERLAEAIELMRGTAEVHSYDGVQYCDCGDKMADHKYRETPCIPDGFRVFIADYEAWLQEYAGGGGLDFEPVHAWFGLTYAQYFAVSRTALQSMPATWQQRFVRCIDEMRDAISWHPPDGSYYVTLRDSKGRFMKDPYADYERGRRRLPRKS